MPLETATYISDLVSSNPPTSDLETQGANHLQLIKTVLQNVFGTVSRRFVNLPNMSAQSGTFNCITANANLTILLNTSGGAANFNLPTLLATDAGWEISLVKVTTDVNPIFIVPPSGTIQSGEYTGLAKARRCIPGRRTRIFWTGSTFICERIDPRPIGTIFDNMFASLPVGYEWANGQILSSSANYPEFFALNGSGQVPDMRGRAAFGLDNMGGVAANRITVAGGNYDGTVVLNAGGLQNHTLTTPELPAHTHPSPTLNDPGHSHATTPASPNIGQTATGNGFTTSNPGAFGNNQVLSINSNTTGITLGANTGSQGSGNPHTIMPPSATMPKLLVVE